MKVLVALASSSGQISGVQRHALNVARCLLLRDEINEVHLVAAPWQMEFVRDALHASCFGEGARLFLQIAPIGNSGMSRNLWFLGELPGLARRLGVDLVHLAYPVPVRSGAFCSPTVVSLHDLYPYDIPENFGYPKVFFSRAVLRQCLRSVDAIACVSQSTRARLEARMPQFHQKSLLIYNSVEPHKVVLADDASHAWARQPFLLCVAQHRRNKNILLALRIFEQMSRAGQLPENTRMIVVGIPGPETPLIERFLAQSGAGHRVDLLNGISEVQLQGCYRNCLLLLAPSSLEGFGLPVAEALLAGCRVVCSDIPAFRELGNELCQYVPLGAREEERFAIAVQSVLGARKAWPSSLPQLSSSAIGEQYLRLYKSLLPASYQEALQGSAFTIEGKRQPLS